MSPCIIVSVGLRPPLLPQPFHVSSCQTDFFVDSARAARVVLGSSSESNSRTPIREDLCGGAPKIVVKAHVQVDDTSI